ncbi:MAG: hypothetical protein ACR2LR_25830 [Hassallia sp.]
MHQNQSELYILCTKNYKVTSFPTKHSSSATQDQKAGSNDNFDESHKRDSQSHERDLQSHERDSQSHERDIQPPEPFLYKDSEVLQTIQIIQTNQTRAGDEKNQQEEYSPTQSVQESPEQVNCQKNTNGQLQRLNSVLEVGETKEPSNSPSRVDTQKSTPRSDNDSRIPANLKAKLEELEIPLDSRVRKVIASYDLSQAYGAAAHVERTWETIDNPRGVFLFQIARQPIEPLGARGQVRQASEFGWTLDFVKRMYPDNWQEAAQHFGVEVQVS